MDGSVRGMSTTNSVRWAGKTWTENSTGAPSAVRVTRSHRRTGDAGRHAEQARRPRASPRPRRSSGWRRRAGWAAARRTASVRRRRGTGAAPSSAGHQTVTMANGSPSARLRRRTRRTCGTPSTSRTRSSGGDEGEVEDAPLGSDARRRQLVLQRGQPGQALADRVAGHEPTEALAGVEQALVAQLLEGPPHRHPAGVVLGRELGLAGQQPARAELAPRRPAGAGRRRSPGSGSCALVSWLSLRWRPGKHPPAWQQGRCRPAARPRCSGGVGRCATIARLRQLVLYLST